MNSEIKKTNLTVSILFGVLIFVFSYYIFTGMTTGKVTSDFIEHMNGAKRILDGELITFLKADSYPMWQILVALSVGLLRMPIDIAAAFVSALLNTITFILLCRFFFDNSFKLQLTAPMTFALLVLGPMYIPWYNANIYLGQGTPNVWHNPTTICVRPFALITFLLITRIIKKCSKVNTCGKKDLIIFAIMLILSNLAKPSFSQGLIPGLGLYFVVMTIKERGKNIVLYLKIIAAFVPSVLLLGIQWIVSFYGTGVREDNGIAISLFEVLEKYAPNVFISFLLGMAFPLYVIICNWKEVKKKSDLQLLACTVLASWLEQALLIETGARKYHGNFGWAYILFMFIAYMYAMREFLLWNKRYDYENRTQKLLVSVGWVLFLIQLMVGIYYSFHLPW